MLCTTQHPGNGIQEYAFSKNDAKEKPPENFQRVMHRKLNMFKTYIVKLFSKIFLPGRREGEKDYEKLLRVSSFN